MLLTDSQFTSFPFWWLDTAFGKMVFVLGFITWGLIIVALILSILVLVRKLFRK